MGGDYTRFTFDPRKDFATVLQQQGRVSVDADWNELMEIGDRRWRAETMDVMGRSAVPDSTPEAFRVTPTGLGAFTIGIGRMYVDGLLVENHGLAPQKYEASLGEQQGATAVPYSDQPYLPKEIVPLLTRSDLPPIQGRTDLIYLDVWQREVTAVQDPEILEVALGGPDTTTRTQTVWQVRALEDVGPHHCADALAVWQDYIQPSAGRLTTAAVAPPAPDSPCILPPTGGYRGLENRLYRVEVHQEGALGAAKFKWSRDNASVVSAVENISSGGDQITVKRLGRDQVLRFRVGDWLEILDDHLEWDRTRTTAGHLAKIKEIDEANQVLTIEPAIPASFSFDPSKPERHTRVQRWDTRKTAGDQVLLDVAAGPVDLEDGVQVSFAADPAGGLFHVGDYWVFAARTADGSVEELDNAPPRGILHHYTRLAYVTWGDSPETTRVIDCREHWPPGRCCTVTVRPGEDIQAAIDRVPAEGGCVCLLPGLHLVDYPILLDGRENLRLTGNGAASKLIYAPASPPTEKLALLYIVGQSHHIQVDNLFIYTDTLPILLVVDGQSQDVSLERLQLVNAGGQGGVGACVLLGEANRVSLAASRLVGLAGLIQANPQVLQAVRRGLATLRAQETPEGKAEGQQSEEPPQVVTVEGLEVVHNEIFAAFGVKLEDVHGGRLERNLLSCLAEKTLPSFLRPEEIKAGTGVETGFYDQLDEKLMALAPPPLSPGLQGQGLLACVLHQFEVRANHLAAAVGMEFRLARNLTLAGNHIQAERLGVGLGYGFEVEIVNNRIQVLKRPDDQKGEETAEAVTASDHLCRAFDDKTAVRQPGLTLTFVRGAVIRHNRIEAPTGIATTSRKSSLSPVSPVKAWAALAAYPGSGCTLGDAASVLRVLGLERPWRLFVEFAWLVYLILKLFSKPGGIISHMAFQPAGSQESPKEAFTRRCFQGLRQLLGSGYLPAFLGKAIIADNRLQVSRHGILFPEILTLGGLRLSGNRISGFTQAGILVHPWLTMGFPDLFGHSLTCLVQWLLAFLIMLRDALRKYLEGEAEPEAPAFAGEWSVAAGMTYGVSWLVYLCSLYCGGQKPSPAGEEPPTLPVQDLLDALDDFLDHFSPAWLDDLVNQDYVIDHNTLKGSGDGIWMGIDGSRISRNTVTISPATTVPYEAVLLGASLSAAGLAGIPGAALLGASMMEGDGDAMVLFGISWMEENINNEDFQKWLREALPLAKAGLAPDSPLLAPVAGMMAALNPQNPDLEQVKILWGQFLAALWTHVKGYGIALVGGDLVCVDNRVVATRGCGLRGFAQPEGEEIGESPFASMGGYLFSSKLRGLLTAPPALGGIWHFSSLVSFLREFFSWFCLKDISPWKLVILVMEYVVAFLLIMSRRYRSLQVAGNEVKEALTHGIRSVDDHTLDELDIYDNSVRDAARYGICHRGLVDSLCHAKVHRNTVGRSPEVFRFQALQALQALKTLSDIFSSLFWVENARGATLMSHNHGDGNQLAGQKQAVFLEAQVVGVMGNHILTSSQLAFVISASKGLFTDNLTDQPNQISATAPPIRQGPNLEDL